MIRLLTLKDTVIEALRGIGAKLFYYHPASWVTLPCVAWRESGNRELARTDGAEHLAEVTYTIDIWSDSAEKNSDIGGEIDRRMTAARFMRTYSADMYETAARLHHRTLRYRAVAGADGRIYQ